MGKEMWNHAIDNINILISRYFDVDCLTANSSRKEIKNVSFSGYDNMFFS